MMDASLQILLFFSKQRESYLGCQSCSSFLNANHVQKRTKTLWRKKKDRPFCGGLFFAKVVQVQNWKKCMMNRDEQEKGHDTTLNKVCFAKA